MKSSFMKLKAGSFGKYTGFGLAKYSSYSTKTLPFNIIASRDAVKLEVIFKSAKDESLVHKLGRLGIKDSEALALMGSGNHLLKEFEDVGIDGLPLIKNIHTSHQVFPSYGSAFKPNQIAVILKFLEKFNVREISFEGDRCLALIIEVLARNICDKISIIDICYPPNVKTIANVLEEATKLKHFAFTSSNIKDDEAIEVLGAIKDNQRLSLSSLELHSNMISDYAIVELANMLYNGRLKTLSYLDISKNPIHNIGAIALLKALTNNQMLKYLNIDQCDNINPELKKFLEDFIYKKASQKSSDVEPYSNFVLKDEIVFSDSIIELDDRRKISLVEEGISTVTKKTKEELIGTETEAEKFNNSFPHHTYHDREDAHQDSCAIDFWDTNPSDVALSGDFIGVDDPTGSDCQ